MKLIDLCKRMDDNAWTEASEVFVRCSVEAALELCDNDVDTAAELFGFDMRELREAYDGEDENPDDKEILEYAVFSNEAECLLYITDVKRISRKFYLVTDFQAQADSIQLAISSSLQPKEVMEKLVRLGAEFGDEVKVVDSFDVGMAERYANDIKYIDRVDSTLIVDMSDVF